jgi:hypothetical protein
MKSTHVKMKNCKGQKLEKEEQNDTMSDREVSQAGGE